MPIRSQRHLREIYGTDASGGGGGGTPVPAGPLALEFQGASRPGDPRALTPVVFRVEGGTPPYTFDPGDGAPLISGIKAPGTYTYSGYYANGEYTASVMDAAAATTEIVVAITGEPQPLILRFNGQRPGTNDASFTAYGGTLPYTFYPGNGSGGVAVQFPKSGVYFTYAGNGGFTAVLQDSGAPQQQDDEYVFLDWYPPGVRRF